MSAPLRPAMIVLGLVLGVTACNGKSTGRRKQRKPVVPVIKTGQLVLTRRGRPQAILVKAGRPTVAARMAARTLQSHLHEVTGARIPITNETRLVGVQVKRGRIVVPGHPPKTVYILVGAGELTGKLGVSLQGIGPGGIVLRTFKNAIAVLGADRRHRSVDPYGTFYAATELLRRAAGIRFLWPGQLGKVVPRRSTLVVGAMRVRYTPQLLQRRIRWMGYNGRIQSGLNRLGLEKAAFQKHRRKAQKTRSRDFGWARWHRLGGTLRVRSGHAFGSYWPRFGKSHPEWFALQPNGSRDQSMWPRRSRLCVSTLALIDQVAKDKIAELSANPRLRGVSVDLNDGGGTTFCMCKPCRKLDVPGAPMVKLRYRYLVNGRVRGGRMKFVSVTDRMVWFWNRIAERVTKVHPKALLVAGAAGGYRFPPMKRKLHANVVIRFNPMTYLRHGHRTRALRSFDAWSRAAKRIYWRPNFLLDGRRVGSGLVYVKRMAADFRRLAQAGLLGTSLDSIAHNWATHGLNYYVAARLVWNPHLDVDQLVDDYCRSGFGTAWRPVCRFLRRIEKETTRVARTNAPITEGFTPKVVDDLRRRLREARSRAKGRPTLLRRIGFLNWGLEFSALQAKVHRLVAQARRRQPFDRALAHKLLEQKLQLMRRIHQEAPFAVHVAYVAWGEFGLIRKLGPNSRRQLHQLQKR